ncbi:MAG: hypothetical protein R3E53_08865 [Myxococcota bacterium]
MLASDHGFVFAVDDWSDCLARIATPNGRIQLALPELFEELDGLAQGSARSGPGVSAGALGRSGARSRRTRSCAIGLAAEGRARARCASARRTRRGSVSQTVGRRVS